MTLHRFFLDPACLSLGSVTFPAEQSHQISHVLRLHTGDQVVVLDGTGRELTVRLEVARKAVLGSVVEENISHNEPRVRITLYQGLLKSTKFELVVQKCTELGVSRFVPMRTSRSVATDHSSSRRQRLERIAREAAEQSRRGVIPAVEEPITFEQAVEQARESGSAILLWEDERAGRLRGYRTQSGDVGLLVGPEGGFSSVEVEAARTAGMVVASLGPRILRSETAAIAGSAILIAELESEIAGERGGDGRLDQVSDRAGH